MRRLNNIYIVETLIEFADADEKAARLLVENGLHRQSVYSSLQAMEKLLKAELARRINLANRGLADLTRLHDLQELGNILIQIVGASNPKMRDQMQSQLDSIIQINPQRDRFLPNNTRYPQLDPRDSTYFVIEMSQQDAIMFLERVTRLKRYLHELRVL